MTGLSIQILAIGISLAIPDEYEWLKILILITGVVAGGVIGLKLQEKNNKDLSDYITSRMNNVSPAKETFEIAKEYTAADGESRIALDQKNRQLGLWKNKVINGAIMSNTLNQYDFEFMLIPFDDILMVEIVVDNASVTRTSRKSQLGGALLGGAIAGGVGAIIGGTSGSQVTTDKMNQIELLITVNDVNKPHRTMTFYREGLGEHMAQHYMKICKEWYSILTHIIKEDDKKIESNTDTHNNMVQKLKELQELKVEGILTDEEFNTQKNKILNNS